MDNIKEEFMWQAAHALPVNANKSIAVLKSYYLQRAAACAETSHMRNDIMCKKCKTYWADGHFDMKILPSNRHRRMKQQNTIEKLKNITRNKRQERLLKKLIERYNHVAKMKCELCHYKTKFILPKPIIKAKNDIADIKIPESVEIKGKKKKKNKEKNAGLNISMSDAVKDRKMLPKLPVTSSIPLDKPKVAVQNKKSNVLANSLKKSAPLSNNKILQLANMLKANANIKKPSDTDKLKHFLK